MRIKGIGMYAAVPVSQQHLPSCQRHASLCLCSDAEHPRGREPVLDPAILGHSLCSCSTVALRRSGCDQAATRQSQSQLQFQALSALTHVRAQYLDMRGRPGLLRTILEAQETRGLTRSDDISRLLPSEVLLSEPSGFSSLLNPVLAVSLLRMRANLSPQALSCSTRDASHMHRGMPGLHNERLQQSCRGLSPELPEPDPATLGSASRHIEGLGHMLPSGAA